MLPVLGVAFIVRIAGWGHGDTWIVLLFSSLVLLGWATHLVGGADAKASLAMALLDSRLLVWAWAGGVFWFQFHQISRYKRGRNFVYPGFIGFAAGVFVNICIGLFM